MASFIFPSEDRIGTFPSNLNPYSVATNILLEPSLALLSRSQRSNSRRNVIYGFDLSAGAGLSVNVAAGYAYANGLILGDTASTNVAGLAASRNINEPNFIFAAVNFVGTPSGDRAMTLAFSSNTTGVVPTDGVCLGIAATDASSVTSYQSSIKNAGSCYVGQYTGDGAYGPSGYRLVFLGSRPNLVILWGVWSDGGTLKNLHAFSAPDEGTRSLYGVSWSTTHQFYMNASNIYVPVVGALGFKVGADHMNQSTRTFTYAAYME